MSALVQLAIIAAMILVAIGMLALRRTVFARMALRNISRRKRFSAIVVVGLLIATAMISAALVMGDTIDYLIKGDVFESTGDVDVVVSMEDDSGLYQFFNQSIAYDLIDLLETGKLDNVDEVAPAIREVAAAIYPLTGTSVPSATVFAYDHDHVVNDLRDVHGNEISVDLMTNGKTVVNEDLADSLEVSVGDTVIVYPKNGLPASLEISAIAADESMGSWQLSEIVFLDLAYAQETIFLHPGMITVIDVSCVGSMEKGYLVTDEAVAELKAIIPDSEEFEFNEVKRDGVEMAEDLSDMNTQLFVLMSSFTIIAGVALIVNIFVMLAEERKSEMGISRAVGMQRGDLTQTFVFEGVIYALMASAVGAFVGLAIAFAMISAFSVVMGGGGFTFVLYFEWDSLALAAVAGFLITMMTVIMSSWRVSRLNIVRAIRDIPEPILAKSEKKYVVSGILSIAFGLLLMLVGADSRQAAATTSGMTLAALGAAIVAVRFVRPRIPFTVSGFWLIFYTVDSRAERFLFGTLEGGLEMFIVAGVAMVTGGVLMAIFNSDIMLHGLVRMFGRGRSLLPVFRAAISYPMNKKFRTGLTLFIFALIMFTVIVLAMIASFQRESVDKLSEKFSGGFEVIGYSLREIPDSNMTAAVAQVDESLGTPSIRRVETARTAIVSMAVKGEDESSTRVLVGFNDEMLTEGAFSLAKRADEYTSDVDAWNAVMEDSSLVILDGNVAPTDITMISEGWFVDVGETVTITFANSSTTDVKVIGIMDQMLINGAFTSKPFVEDHVPASAENLFYIDTYSDPTFTDDDVKEGLERALAEYGLTVIVVRDILEEFMSTTASVMQLMELFLGVGLVVGIAGLGIITIRNISERRQEIGVMRAIGFQRKMILATFLIETSYVSLLGIAMGIVLGLLISHSLFTWGGFSEYSDFVIPWWEILLVLLVAFTVTIAATLPPSRRASRMTPAEALRRVD
ncbi:MAG: FtsX-like permease family protein [Thermoplasmata archaeon]|nr:FtsX-like permease family protein [Thermoplasmata archaeon]